MGKAKISQSTKQKLLDTALQLFYQRGYDTTSIDLIVRNAQVSKGAFYHYFESKEDLLTAIAQLRCEELMKVLENITQNSKLNAVDKFNQFIIQANAFKIANKKNLLMVYNLMESNQNVKLKEKIEEITHQKISPLLKVIFKQGVDEGVFTSPYAQDFAEMHLYLSMGFTRPLVKLVMGMSKKPRNKEIIERKMLFWQDLLERVLGAKKGSFNFAPEVMKCILEITKS